MKAIRLPTSLLAWASSSTPGPLPSRQAPSLRTLTTASSPTGGGGPDDQNRNVGETLHDPKRWPSPAALSGMIVVAFLNLTASSVPEALQVTAVKVLVPAANLLVNTDDAGYLLAGGD